SMTSLIGLVGIRLLSGRHYPVSTLLLPAQAGVIHVIPPTGCRWSLLPCTSAAGGLPSGRAAQCGLPWLLADQPGGGYGEGDDRGRMAGGGEPFPDGAFPA